MHSGKSATIRESNHGAGVCKEHYALYYVPKSSILFTGKGEVKISSVALLKSIISLISRINEVYVFYNKIEKHKLH